MLDFDGLRQAILEGDRDAVGQLVSAALEAGVDASAILDQGLLPAMDVVGKRFGVKEMYISEVLLSARAMHTGIALLKPVLAKSNAHAGSRPVVILGTVKGDLHDIGKNLVAMLLQGAGFTVVNLGTGVSPADFVAAVREHAPRIVGMSALLTTTLPHMSETIAALKDEGLRDSVKVMVGGAPVTAAYAEEIGADGYGANAGMAVDRAKGLVG
jgi:5-methyltetrahydrofolate--homocysteine methyltransferase